MPIGLKERQDRLKERMEFQKLIQAFEKQSLTAKELTRRGIEQQKQTVNHGTE